MMQEKNVAEALLLILKGKAGKYLPSSQQDLQNALLKMGLDVNQSSISRALKKIGAVKNKDSKGNIVYQLVTSSEQQQGKILSVISNESLILVKTAPGMASWAAYHLDQSCHPRILGTIAGDDTIIVVPSSVKKIQETITAVNDIFSKMN